MKSLFKTFLALALVLGSSSSSFAAGGDLIDMANQNGHFKTLVSFVQKAGLETAWRSADVKTIFAPTDDAFAKLTSDQMNRLQTDSAYLMSVLLYHAVEGKILVSALDKSTAISKVTLNGQSLIVKFNIATNMFMVNGANITSPDMDASNGELQGIDSVLIPMIR